MRPKSFALLLLALGCGMVASIGITQLMRKGTAPEALNGGGVFVAATDIGMGEQLSGRVLRLEAWPTGKIPSGAISRIEDVEGRRTRTRLYPGEPILENKLFAKGVNAQGAAAMISKGFRMVSVKVDLVSGASSLILPGDTVDVMVHLVRDPARDISETVTRTILQDIKVFAVNDILNTERDKEGGRSINAKTISLLVTPAQAAKLTLASQLGSINLVMRGPEDDKSINIAEARPSDLTGVPSKNSRETDSQGENIPAAKSAPAQPAVPTQPVVAEVKPRATWTMRTLKPSGIEEVVFEAEEGKTDLATPGSWKIVGGGGAAGAVPPKDDAKPADAPASNPPPSNDGPPKKETPREVAKGSKG